MNQSFPEKPEGPENYGPISQDEQDLNRVIYVLTGLVSLLFPGQPMKEIMLTLANEGQKAIKEFMDANSGEGTQATEGSGAVSEG